MECNWIIFTWTATKFSFFYGAKNALNYAIDTLHRYKNIEDSLTYVKNTVITGAPGSGKTYLTNIIALYAISLGFNVGITASMSQRAIQIGVLHIHKLFGIPVNKKLPFHILSETAICNLLRKPERLYILKVSNVLFMDEIGQVSSELLALLNMILQNIRIYIYIYIWVNYCWYVH